MKGFARLVTISCLTSFFTALACGQSPITTLTCTSAQGSTLSIPVYYFDLGALENYSNPNTLYLQSDLSTYAALSSPTAPTSYSTCSMGSDAASLSLSNGTFSYVSASGSGAVEASTPAEAYTTANLNSSSVTYTGTPSVDGQAPLGTFSCQAGDGSTLIAPVLGYQLTYSTNSPGNINLDFSYFSKLISAGIPNANCLLSVAGTTILLPEFELYSVDAIGSGAGVSTSKPQLTASISWSQYNTDVVTGATDYSGISPIATLTCQSTGSTFTMPVYYFSLYPQSDSFLTVEVDLAEIARLSADNNAGVTYSTCVLDDGVVPITLSNAIQDYANLVTGYGGGLGSAAPQLYAAAEFHYSALTVGSLTVSGATTAPGDRLRAPRARR